MEVSAYTLVSWFFVIVFLILMIGDFILGAITLYQAYKKQISTNTIKNLFILFVVVAGVTVATFVVWLFFYILDPKTHAEWYGLTNKEQDEA